MNLLSSLNPVSVISSAAESLCDAILPKELEFAGDLAGLAVDFESANWTKCIDDVEDLFKDLPQQLAQITGGKAGETEDRDALMQPSFLDPSPPPRSGLAANDPTGLSLGSGAIGTELGALLKQMGVPNAAGPSVSPSQPPAGASAAAPTARGASMKPVPQVATPAAASPSAASSASGSTSSIDAFFAKSDTELMNAVRSGNIPQAVKDDKAAMQRLQLRMNDISEMNQLITNMLKAMHDMNQSVIQNIRV